MEMKYQKISLELYLMITVLFSCPSLLTCLVRPASDSMRLLQSSQNHAEFLKTILPIYIIEDGS